MSEKLAKRPESARLDEIYRTVQMGAGAAEHLIKVSRDNKLSEALTDELQAYRALEAAALNRFTRRHEKTQDPGDITKLMAGAGIRMNTAVDSSSSHIAEMFIQGASMGVTELCGAINSYGSSHVSQETRKIADALLERLEDGIERFKPFLK